MNGALQTYGHTHDHQSEGCDKLKFRVGGSHVIQAIEGYLMYSINAKSNICFAINILNQFMVESRQKHWVAAKQMLSNLRVAMEHGLRYLGDGKVKLQGGIQTQIGQVV